MDKLILQRFETKQSLREVLSAKGFGESLYNLIQLLLEVELD